MDSKTTRIGRIGEDMAREYLAKSGYRILFRNYREKVGEIDIVAKAKTGTLIIFEVKTLKDQKDALLMPEDNLSSGKLEKLRRISELFVAKHPELVDERRGWQIDLLAIEISNEAVTGKNPANKIRHYENI